MDSTIMVITVLAGLGTVVAMAGSTSKATWKSDVNPPSIANIETKTEVTQGYAAPDPCSQVPNEIQEAVKKALGLNGASPDIQATQGELKALAIKHKAFVDACPTAMAEAEKHLANISTKIPDCSALEGSLNALKLDIEALTDKSTMNQWKDANTRLAAVYSNAKNQSDCQAVLTKFEHLKNDLCEKFKAGLTTMQTFMSLTPDAMTVHEWKDIRVELEKGLVDPASLVACVDTTVIGGIEMTLNDLIAKKIRAYREIDLGNCSDMTPVSDLKVAQAELQKVISDADFQRLYPDEVSEYTTMKNDVIDQILLDALARSP